jgi:hypothetical protein
MLVLERRVHFARLEESQSFIFLVVCALDSVVWC